MKSKTINAILSKRFDEFLTSIEDPAVRNLVKDNTIITGGSIVSMLLNANVNDFDLYFRSKAVATEVAKYYVGVFQNNPPTTFKGSDGKLTVAIRVEEEPRLKIVVKSAGIVGETGAQSYEYFEQDPVAGGQNAAEYINGSIGQAEKLDEEPAAKLEADGGKKYRPIFMTSNAITLANKVQLVLRFYGEPEEIHKNYDYEHCTNYWTSWERKVVLRPEALESILTKELRYRGSLYPICSIVRMRKFLAQGWTVNAGQILKMCWQVGKLDLTNPAVLEEQLVGVDSAYFSQLIYQMQQVDLKTVDDGYVATLIDKIF